MSEGYQIDGVTVTPQPGGYYELSHPSLPEPEKIRGKEKADDRAKEVAAAAAQSEGFMEQQPPIDEVIPPASPAAPEAPATEPAAAPQGSSDVDDLKALVAKQSEMIAQLLAAAATTVVAAEPAAAPDPFATMSREFSGQVDAKARKAAAALGVEYVTIILEEGNDIPPTGLFLGHNGRSYMITPGEPVDVPDFLLGVLDDAIMSAPVVDGKTQKVLGYRNRMKYPYRRV